MTPTNTDVDRPDSVASIADNAKLEHTEGGATTRDAMDAGVPMLPGSPDEPQGPEDAYGPGPKRGDYSGRTQAGPSMVTEVIPEAERRAEAEKIVKASKGTLTVAQALGDVPRTRLVSQEARAGEQGDAPGKGGVTTAATSSAPAAEERAS